MMTTKQAKLAIGMFDSMLQRWRGPRSWTQGADARGVDGHSCVSKSEMASCWCVSGNFSACARGDCAAQDEAWAELGKATEKMTDGKLDDPVAFNDDCGTHKKDMVNLVKMARQHCVDLLK